MVMVHLDARWPGVRVPPALRGDAQLRLNLSYRFPNHDLSVGDEIIGCTLSFIGQPYYCELPVDAIFAAASHVTGEFQVWPAEPLEGQRAHAISLAVVAPAEGKGRAKGTDSEVPARRHLRLVK